MICVRNFAGSPHPHAYPQPVTQPYQAVRLFSTSSITSHRSSSLALASCASDPTTESYSFFKLCFSDNFITPHIVSFYYLRHSFCKGCLFTITVSPSALSVSSASSCRSHFIALHSIAELNSGVKRLHTPYILPRAGDFNVMHIYHALIWSP
jgi:hypothetical protein